VFLMGNCPNCNRHYLFLKTMNCNICGKQICEKCRIYLFKIWDSKGIIVDSWYACSFKCLEKFATKVEAQTTPEDIDILKNLSAGIPLIVKRSLGLNIDYRVIFSPLEELDLNPRGNLLWKRLQKLQEYVESVTIQNLLKAGNYEEVARLYEKRGLYEEAGKVRARNREMIIKKTEVKVDLNNLLKQIAEEGIVAVYRCPHCGGRLKIGKDTTATNLRVCEHCGSEIETMDLADFLKTVLS
jgi:DNA-directed RNA polymerase subunit RPC12/RpoP